MKNAPKNKNLAIGFIVVAALSRLLPHLPNFTAMESLALFAGAYLGWKVIAYAIPVLLWYGTDFVINNTISRPFFSDHEGLVWFADYMPWVYISSIIILLIGAKFLAKWSPVKLAASALIASLIFFVISNIGVWASGTMYPMTIGGLTACFVAALPFLKTSIFSNLMFVAILFGGYELVYYMLYKQKAQFV